MPHQGFVKIGSAIVYDRRIDGHIVCVCVNNGHALTKKEKSVPRIHIQVSVLLCTHLQG